MSLLNRSDKALSNLAIWTAGIVVLLTLTLLVTAFVKLIYWIATA